MTPKQSRGAPRLINPDAAVPPALGPSRRQSEHRAATGRLLARLKALERPQETQTPRAYARRYVREQESLILGLLNVGVGIEEILADLARTFPSIPTADIRHALAQLRDRRRKHLAARTSAGEGASASTAVPGSLAGETGVPSSPRAPSGADRPPQEPDEEERLRRAERSRDRRISRGSSSVSTARHLQRASRGIIRAQNPPVDGDKGGVGKSFATRALVQCYLEQPADHRPRLVVLDSRIGPVADELRELLPGRTPRFDRAPEVDRSDYGEINVGARVSPISARCIARTAWLAAGDRREYYRPRAAPCAEQEARTQGRGGVR